MKCLQTRTDHLYKLTGTNFHYSATGTHGSSGRLGLGYVKAWKVGAVILLTSCLKLWLEVKLTLITT